MRATFTLRNLHPWAVTVTGITSDCGCTKAFVGKTPPFRLAPFEAVSFKASIDTRAKQDRISQTVQVATSESQQVTSLRLRGVVQQPKEQLTTWDREKNNHDENHQE